MGFSSDILCLLNKVSLQRTATSPYCGNDLGLHLEGKRAQKDKIRCG